MATMKKLRAHGLSVPNILDTPDAKLNELIHAVGFHNNKVDYILTLTNPNPNPNPQPHPHPHPHPNPHP